MSVDIASWLIDPWEIKIKFYIINCELIWVIDGWVISNETAFGWMLVDFANEESILVQVNIQYKHRTASHCMSQCWPSCMAPYGTIGLHYDLWQDYAICVYFGYIHIYIYISTRMWHMTSSPVIISKIIVFDIIRYVVFYSAAKFQRPIQQPSNMTAKCDIRRYWKLKVKPNPGIHGNIALTIFYPSVFVSSW